MIKNLPKTLRQLENRLDLYLRQKAPWQIPKDGREFLVKALPWVDIILVLLLIPRLLAVITLGAAAVYIESGDITVGFFANIALAVLLVKGVVMAMAVKGLFKQQRKGWKLLYGATLIGFVHGVLVWASLPAALGAFIWSLISTVIALYVLFQVREYYTG